MAKKLDPEEKPREEKPREQIVMPEYKPEPKKTIDLNFDLWPKQLYAFRTWANQILYGGAAGGGKSHLERVLSISWCLDIPGLQYFLFRRNFQDLIKSYVRGENGYEAMLRPLMHDPDVKNAEIIAKEIRFPNKSTIYLCHCQYEKNVLQFGSFEFHVLNIAEAGEFTPFMFNYLHSRIRMPVEMQRKLPQKYWIPKECWRNPEEPEYQFPRSVITANPVGPGKALLEKEFVDARPAGKIERVSDDKGGMFRQYIPAKLGDNPSLNRDEYASKIKGIGSKAYVEALLEGNWKVTIGAFFPQISKAVHLCRRFAIPEHWPRFMAMDWGACGDGDPFSIGWYTVAMEDKMVQSPITGQIITCPKEAMICYRRWNGKGLPKVNVKFVAEGIQERESKGENILFRIAGGDILEQRGHGESIFGLFAKHDLRFRRADMRRRNGWGQVDYRLDFDAGAPLSFWFEECEEDLTGMSNLQYHPVDLDDIANGQEDHDADRHRYACMTRPKGEEMKEEVETDYRDKNKRATVSDLIKIINTPEKPSLVSRR